MSKLASPVLVYGPLRAIVTCNERRVIFSVLELRAVAASLIICFGEHALGSDLDIYYVSDNSPSRSRVMSRCGHPSKAEWLACTAMQPRCN